MAFLTPFHTLRAVSSKAWSVLSHQPFTAPMTFWMTDRTPFTAPSMTLLMPFQMFDAVDSMEFQVLDHQFEIAETIV